MQSLQRSVFLLVLILFYRGGDATRYLPSIVWDHLNPMLSCKCNWFNPMAYMEIYDRFEFVCPTPKITVVLLDSYSRPADQMNLNLFQRKWKGGKDQKGIEQLKKQLLSGEFCDPNSTETKRVFQCLNGKDGQGTNIRFARDTGFYKDDIVVFFNNADDGRVSSLTSLKKTCAMALVVKVTWGLTEMYDFTYKKNLTKDDPRCNSVMCGEAVSTPSPDKSTSQLTNTTSSTRHTTNHNRTTKSTTKTPSPTRGEPNSSTPTINRNTTVVNASIGHRSSSESWDNFTYGVLVGCGATLLVVISVVLVYFFLCRKPKNEKTKTNSVCHFKTGEQCQCTIVNDLGSEREAEALPQKTRFPPLPPIPKLPRNGVNNKAYLTQTLERGSVKA